MLVKETGLAISPVVALSYLALTNDPIIERYKPAVWIVIALLIAVLLKDSAGTLVPGVLKKPLDAIEFFQNQGLGLFCAALIVPQLHAKVASLLAQQPSLTSFFHGGSGPYLLAATGIDTQALLHVVTLPLSIAIYVAVWLLSNTINALTLVSPFSTVDAALKSIKVVGLTALAGLAAIHPLLGALLSLAIIVIAFALSGWAFRLYHFGWVFAVDLLTRRHRRPEGEAKEWTVFLDHGVPKIPARTYGKLIPSASGDEIHFEYRPWLVLPRRSLALSLDKEAFELGRGLIHLTLRPRPGQPPSAPFFFLPPRYRGHEDRLALEWGIPVVDAGLRKGWKAAMQWIGASLPQRHGTAATPIP
jgi:hypothetical protein